MTAALILALPPLAVLLALAVWCGCKRNDGGLE